jgi:superoxide dismutase, Fe-Mn family
MSIKFIRDFILGEARLGGSRLVKIKLPYELNDLSPVISENTMRYHYEKLYKSYVDKYNNLEGDAGFNEAGAFLHKLYFEQFMKPSTDNSPTGEIETMISNKFKDFDNFKAKFEESAMGIMGSGWIYLSTDGQIKIIENHAIKRDILLLVDWWEHSWALDYQEKKSEYLNNIWKIIDWNLINSRL